MSVTVQIQCGLRRTNERDLYEFSKIYTGKHLYSKILTKFSHIYAIKYIQCFCESFENKQSCLNYRDFIVLKAQTLQMPEFQKQNEIFGFCLL
jgi:hypothetical protein